MRRLLAIVAAVFCMAAAPDPSDVLPDPEQEARARALFKEIRCVVCQNESIDDSEADIAQDLRAVVREQIVQGRSDDDVKTFLVARYGEFVLLRPTFSAGNAALWLAPFVILLLGSAVFLATTRRNASAVVLSPEEERRLEALEAAPRSDDAKLI